MTFVKLVDFAGRLDEGRTALLGSLHSHPVAATDTAHAEITDKYPSHCQQLGVANEYATGSNIQRRGPANRGHSMDHYR